MTDWNGDGTHDSYDDYMDYHVACGDDSSSSGSGGGHYSGGGGGCLTHIWIGALYVLIGGLVLIIILSMTGGKSFTDFIAYLLFPVIVIGVLWFFAWFFS